MIPEMATLPRFELSRFLEAQRRWKRWNDLYIYILTAFTRFSIDKFGLETVLGLSLLHRTTLSECKRLHEGKRESAVCFWERDVAVRWNVNFEIENTVVCKVLYFFSFFSSCENLLFILFGIWNLVYNDDYIVIFLFLELDRWMEKFEWYGTRQYDVCWK